MKVSLPTKPSGEHLRNGKLGLTQNPVARTSFFVAFSYFCIALGSHSRPYFSQYIWKCADSSLQVWLNINLLACTAAFGWDSVISLTSNYLTGSANYFLLLVHRIIFFFGADNYFSQYRDFIFWPKIHCGLAIEEDWSEWWTSLTDIWNWNCCDRREEKNIARECQGEALSEKEMKEAFTFSYNHKKYF